MDFTLQRYRQLLSALKVGGYSSVFRFGTGGEREVLLRHDVDLRPQHSLRIAQIEAEMGFHAIYYFRMVPESWDLPIVKQISSLGHDIGYHYESLTTCQGDVSAAYADFCRNLDVISQSVGRSVSTICMHGSPRSPYDSKNIWSHYDYHRLGIDFEPYLDTDFSSVFYLTDTGRRWDGCKVSVRDKIPHFQDEWLRQGLTYHATKQVVSALSDKASPLSVSYKKIMITTHPQRWMPLGLGWIREMVSQRLKNIVKALLIRYR